ncbi:MAG: hypothetical protein WBE76_21240 [Terracidiphilus sp.]
MRISPIDTRRWSACVEIGIDYGNDPNEQIEDTLGQGLNARKATETDKRQQETVLNQILTVLTDRQVPKESKQTPKSRPHRLYLPASGGVRTLAKETSSYKNFNRESPAKERSF